jgi:hypothetical protein
MNWKVLINTQGKITVETSNVTGSGCLAISRLVRDATSGSIESLSQKPEFFETDQEVYNDQNINLEI